MADAITVNASDAFRGQTITVTVRVRQDWRFRLGLLLMRLGAWVLRSRFEVES